MAEEEAVTTTDNVDEVVETTTPEVTEEVAPTEEAKAETDTEGETVEKEEVKPKPDPKVAKARFEARELRRENKRLAKMLETQIETAAKAQPKAQTPKIEDFETMDDYLNARDEYRDSQKEAKSAPKTEARNEYADVRDEMFASGLEKYEDFEDVVLSSTSIMPSMANAILEIDDPDVQVDVAYFIGNNKKEAARIARLSERRQIAEIAKIEVKLSTKAPAKKKASKAPAPIKPVGGTKTPSSEIQPVESYDSFLKKRNKQLGR